MVIIGIIIILLIIEAFTIPVFLPSILLGLIPLVLPIICGSLLKPLVKKLDNDAARKIAMQKSLIDQKYANALSEARAEDTQANKINLKLKQELQEKFRIERAPIEAELAAHKARLNEINVVGTNEKTIPYLQTLIGYMESMRADSIKEAINLAVSENRIRSEQIVRQFQENMRAEENRRMQEQLLDEARRTRRAEEARAAEAKKASDSLDKIQRDLDYELTYGKRP